MKVWLIVGGVVLAAVVAVGVVVVMNQAAGPLPAASTEPAAVQPPVAVEEMAPVDTAGSTEHAPVVATSSDLPNLTLTTAAGETVQLHDYFGTPLVINAWATWCPFCVKELPDFVTAQEQFGDQVRIIAIDRAESAEAAVGYTDDLGISDQLTFLLDESDSFYRAIGGFSMPETIFVTANGEIQFHKRGPMPLDEINQRIADLLTS